MKTGRRFIILFASILMVSSGSSQDHKAWLESVAHEMNIWMLQGDTLGQLALEYRLKPLSEGGGAGSYVGFTVPSEYRFGKIAQFTVHDAVENEIVFSVLHRRTGFSYFLVIDQRGKRMEESSKSPERWKNLGAMVPELYTIIKSAQAYRKAVAEERGVLPTYEGFVIPIELASTEHAMYYLEEVERNLMIIRAVETNKLGTDYYKVDEKGKLRLCIFGEYRPKNR